MYSKSAEVLGGVNGGQSAVVLGEILLAIDHTSTHARDSGVEDIFPMSVGSHPFVHKILRIEGVHATGGGDEQDVLTDVVFRRVSEIIVQIHGSRVILCGAVQGAVPG